MFGRKAGRKRNRTVQTSDIKQKNTWFKTFLLKLLSSKYLYGIFFILLFKTFKLKKAVGLLSERGGGGASGRGFCQGAGGTGGVASLFERHNTGFFSSAFDAARTRTYTHTVYNTSFRGRSAVVHRRTSHAPAPRARTQRRRRGRGLGAKIPNIFHWDPRH